MEQIPVVPEDIPQTPSIQEEVLDTSGNVSQTTAMTKDVSNASGNVSQTNSMTKEISQTLGNFSQTPLMEEESLPVTTNGAPSNVAFVGDGQEQSPAADINKDLLRVDDVPSTEGETVKVPSSQAVVAHRSPIFDNCQELNEESARKLLNDSGWNVTQSVRSGGHQQWYYRSPRPKTVLVGSLTSAVAMWKKLMDEEYRRQGGGDEDPYPLVTAFLSDKKLPPSKKKKKKRPRYI